MDVITYEIIVSETMIRLTKYVKINRKLTIFINIT